MTKDSFQIHIYNLKWGIVSDCTMVVFKDLGEGRAISMANAILVFLYLSKKENLYSWYCWKIAILLHKDYIIQYMQKELKWACIGRLLISEHMTS